MTKDEPRTSKPSFDLEERTARFGEEVIRFCRPLAMTPITEPLVRQIVRSATSVGANYCEADDSVSKREFRLKIGTCKKEARETKHWLRMLAVAVPEQTEPARTLWREAHELTLIFSTIYRKLSVKKPAPGSTPSSNPPNRGDAVPSSFEIRPSALFAGH